MIRFHCWPAASWSPPENTKRNNLNYFTIPSLIFFLQFSGLHLIVKTLNSEKCETGVGLCLLAVLALVGPCSLIAPCRIHPPHCGELPQECQGRHFPNILTGKLHFEESQWDESSCDGLQAELHCAWNTHASTEGESSRRVHKGMPILLPLIPKWSQILASLETSLQGCVCTDLKAGSLKHPFSDWLRTQGMRNAENLICYITARCRKTALLYW